jgi:oxygen-independent coproporphyrinogen-3 oxidase
MTKDYSQMVYNIIKPLALREDPVKIYRNVIDEDFNSRPRDFLVYSSGVSDSPRLYGDGTHFDPANDHVQRMLDHAYDVLRCRGYVPYYMYRQKNTVSNGENIGFCLPDKICRYNLYMMEDLHTIAACGAGASSKIISGKDGRIERVINMKYPYEYINENERIAKNTLTLDQKLKETL